MNASRSRDDQSEAVLGSPFGEQLTIPATIDSVVLPLDGSPFAARAVPVAEWLAYRLDASITVVSAVTRATDVAARRRQLDDMPLSPRCLERIVVVDADAAHAIHEALRRSQPSVACFASHGRGRAAAFIGSVATDIVARGHDSVVLIGPMFDIRPTRCGVVACVDGTPASRGLLDVALRWAELLAEPLVVMTVAEPVAPPLAGGAVRRRFGPHGQVDEWLELLTAPAREVFGAVDTAVVYDPISPVDGVRRFLGARRPSIAVIASRARIGVSRLLHGSVASRIVYQSPSPVLVVPRLEPSRHRQCRTG